MMVPGVKSHNSAIKQLSAYIRANGMRPSRVRKMVLEQICLLPQPFTAEELVTACQKDRISTGTIYNALNLFVLARILHVRDRERGRAVSEYELITGKPMRMQMTCTKCGRVTEIHDKAIEGLIKERKYSNFVMQHFSLFVYGECKLCRRPVEKQIENGTRSSTRT